MISGRRWSVGGAFANQMFSATPRFCKKAHWPSSASKVFWNQSTSWTGWWMGASDPVLCHSRNAVCPILKLTRIDLWCNCFFFLVFLFSWAQTPFSSGLLKRQCHMWLTSVSEQTQSITFITKMSTFLMRGQFTRFTHRIVIVFLFCDLCCIVT